jgi:hypothetical protein
LWRRPRLKLSCGAKEIRRRKEREIMKIVDGGNLPM